MRPGADQGFLTEAVELRRLRRRAGAVHWHLQRDLDDPMLFTEQFSVGSWDDHERQHERIQAGDRAVLTRIDGLLAPGEKRTARHALGIRVSHHD